MLKLVGKQCRLRNWEPRSSWFNQLFYLNVKGHERNTIHDVGDNVLETSAKLLKSSIRSNDFIARFGGDEFCIVLDVSDKAYLEATVSRINDCIEKYNESCDHPYKISFSMGYAVYDYNSGMKVEEFSKTNRHIDVWE